MINLKEYIVTLMAMFLSLGIGIMVGTSITESVVVEQQKFLIEQLENRYYATLGEMEQLSQEKRDRESLLHLYDTASERLLPRDSFADLKGREVFVISLDAERGQEICDFLDGHDMQVNPHIFAAGSGQEESGKMEDILKEVFSLADFLLKGRDTGDIPGENHIGAVFTRPLEAQVLLVVLGGITLQASQGRLLQEFLQEFASMEVVVLEDYFLEGLSFSGAGERVRVIDYIDTTPGKLALLAFLKGSREVFSLKPLLKEQGQ